MWNLIEKQRTSGRQENVEKLEGGNVCRCCCCCSSSSSSSSSSSYGPQFFSSSSIYHGPKLNQPGKTNGEARHSIFAPRLPETIVAERCLLAGLHYCPRAYSSHCFVCSYCLAPATNRNMRQFAHLAATFRLHPGFGKALHLAHYHTAIPCPP